MMQKRGYSLLFLVGFLACCEAIPCREGAVEHNGNCFRLYTDKKPFEEANQACAAAPGGGQIVKINSVDLQEFVKTEMERGNVNALWIGATMQITDWRWAETDSYLKYQGCFSDNDDARLDVYVGSSANYTPDSCIVECQKRNMTYAGVKRSNNDGNMIACRCGNNYHYDAYAANSLCELACPSDNEQKCGNFALMRIYSVQSTGETGWRSKQPNDLKQSYQGCLAMHKSNHYKWGDEQCHGEMEPYGYLCQYDSDKAKCSHRYDAGKCYSVHVPSSPGVSWYKVRYLCKKDGGNLLQVDTKEIFEFLKNGSAQLDLSVNRWWIGGTKVRWQWTNGEDMIFTNWAMDRPESESKACAVVGKDVGQSYEWEDRSCSDTAAFFCQEYEPSMSTEPATTTARTTTVMQTTPITTKKTMPTQPPTTQPPTTQPQTTQPPTTQPPTTQPPTTQPPRTQPPRTQLSTTQSPATQPPATQPPRTQPPITIAETEATSSSPDAAKTTAKKTVFTTGIIIAIVIGCVIVVLIALRVLIYCCTNTRSHNFRKKSTFDVNNHAKSGTLISYDNPDYEKWPYEDSSQQETTEPIGQQDDMYSY